MFGEQDWMFASQNHLLRRLISHDIDYAVVDSSILLSLFYLPDDFPQSFRSFVVDAFNTYDNINIFIDRNPDLPYVQAGRNQTLDEAKLVDDEIHQYFLDNKIPHHVVTAGATAADRCLHIVQQHRKWSDGLRHNEIADDDYCPRCGNLWVDHEFGVPAPFCP